MGGGLAARKGSNTRRSASPTGVENRQASQIDEAARNVEVLGATLEELRVSQEELLAAREQLEAERERYHDLFEFAPGGYVVTNRYGRIVEANRATAELFGVGKSYIIDKPLSVYVAPDDRLPFSANLHRLRTENRVEARLAFRPREGPLRILHVTAAAVRGWDGKLTAIRWMLRDVTIQSKQEQELIDSEARLKEMAAQVAEVEERERRRIATDLHDHISQSLAVARLRLGMLGSELPEAARQRVEEVRELLSTVLQQSRTLTFELSPTVLYEFGVGAGIEWLIEQRSGYGVNFKLQNDAPRLRLVTATEVTLFQVMRELLTNVVKHSKASEARVRIGTADGSLRIEVNDNGVGFDAAERLNRRGGDSSIGLFSIRERLEYLNGRVVFDSLPGKGTRITLAVPVEESKAGPKQGRSHVAQRAHRR